MAIVIPAGFEDFTNQRNPTHEGRVPHVIGSLIPQSKCSLCHARVGTFKTMLGIDMGVRIVLGAKDFLGLPINEHGSVMFVDAEDQADENGNRIILLAKGLGYQGWPPGFIYHSVNVGELMKPAVVERIAELARRVGGVVLTIIDSYLQASGLDHWGAGTDSKINAFYGQLRKLGTCLVLDHETDTPNGVATADARPAGNSTKKVPVRSVFGLRKAGNAFELKQSKGLYGLLPPFRFAVDFSDDLTQIDIHRVGAVCAPVRSGATTAAEHWVVAAIRDLRGGEPVSRAEIISATGKSRASVYENVKKLKDKGILSETGKLLAIIPI